MKPQTEAFLGAADEALTNARDILSINIQRQAARLSYYAQFHAAQALIFERTDKISKSHKGVSREFHNLARAEPNLPGELGAKLSAAYYYKEVADYDTGTAPPITTNQAREAIDTAEHFVAIIRQALTS
jgi:uncharacterized protein (UPF0332 family)